MTKKSAGILLYRFRESLIEVLLVHPGGPFWKNKETGAWSVPKGEFTDEDPLSAAIREFNEETGTLLDGRFISLSPVQQKAGKTIFVFAQERDLDPQKIVSNFFEIEWPPRSGKKQNFPEIDKAEWFSSVRAKEKINPAQAKLIDELLGYLKIG